MHNAYGSQKVLKKYLGLRSYRFLRVPEIVWHHGWSPNIWNYDIDQIVGESGQTSDLAHLTYLVARRDQEMALKQAGLENVWATGLPFAYAMILAKEEVSRIPNSALIVPALHGSFSPDNPTHMDTEYLDFLDKNLKSFSHVRVLMNCDDIQLGRNEEWEKRGFQIVLGGCEEDEESLPRIVNIFKEFEVMTTNEFGSPIAYAAAAGCRISISGPKPTLNLKGTVWVAPFYQNRVDLGLTAESWFSRTETYFSDRNLIRLPSEAQLAEEWGKKEIGYDAVRPPEELKKIILEAYRGHTSPVDRLGLRPLKKRVRSFQRFVAVAAIRETDHNFPNPLTFGKNLWTLMKRSGKLFRSISLTDSRTPIRFRPDSSDIDNLYQHFVERELDGFDIGEPSRILDIGSYAGYSILFLTRKFPQAQIVGVEADSDNFELCSTQHADNPRVKLINKAVWAENTTVSLLAGPEGAWSNKTIPETDEFPTVEGITLPGILQEVGWDSVDVIKMDIEGSEYEVLKTVATDISRMCSVLLVEFHHKLARKKELDALIEKITSGTKATVTEVGEFTVFDFR